MATERAEALAAYIADYDGPLDLWGGIVVKAAGQWRLNANRTYKFDLGDLTTWEALEF